jgi:hypothetical protein
VTPVRAVLLDFCCTLVDLNHNGLRFGLVVDSETARCYKPDPRIF